MLLYEQAQRQIDQSPLRVQAIPVSDLFAYASQSYGIECRHTDASVKGDGMLLRLFLDQMFAIVPKSVTLTAEQHEGMIYIICDVPGHKLTPEELSDLFSPQTERLEYLVMRQIVREHDAACGHPGLRLVAENTEHGYRIAFSLLQRNIVISK